MQGYYDHHPLLTLERHLVVTGYLSAETRKVGFQLSALTGVGVSDVDRTIEHYAGKSIWRLIAKDGEERYRQWERQVLMRLLAAEPRSIVTLGDGTLIDEANRRQVVEETQLVVLDLDLTECFWRLWQGPQVEQKNWHPLYAGPVERFEQVRPFHELRRPGFAEAQHRIELRGKSRKDVVARLMELIEP